MNSCYFGHTFGQKDFFTGCLSYGYFIFVLITSDLQYIFWDLNLLIYKYIFFS